MLGLIRGLVITVIVLIAAAYVGDWAVFKMRGAPQATVTVSHFMSVPLKSNEKSSREEIDYLGSDETSCSISMFPQSGMAPCWYLRKHHNQVQTY